MAIKIRKEYSIALIFLLAILIFIWGFKFLKGINMFSSNQIFYVKYQDAMQLTPSSPVFINGLEVGSVKEMYVDPEDDKTIIAVLNIKGNLDIHKRTKAAIVSLSVMGGKAVELQIPGPCDGADCAQNNDFLEGSSKTFLESIVGKPEELEVYSEKLRYALTTVYDSISDPNDPKGIGKTLLAINQATTNLAVMTGKINRMLDASTSGISATANNTAEITKAIRDNNQNISNALKNLEQITVQLRDSDIKGSVAKAGTALDSVTLTVGTLRSSLSDLQNTLLQTDTLMSRLNDGQGSAGKMLTDVALYDNLARSTRHLNLLLQDVRLNPKRYNTVKLKIFGKNKQPDYQNPIDDPAYQLMLDSLERDYDMKQRLKN